jgi:tetratricopeptide (TPR) repeat protein
MLAYNAGLLLAGRIEELLASITRLHDITPAPGAAGWIALALLAGVFFLDTFGRIPQGTALEDSFRALVRARGDQEPLARMWWNTTIATRASYAHDDPWAALACCAEIQKIFDMLGGELIFVSMQLLRGLNRWYLGALALAVQSLEGIPVADTAMGVVSSLRRFLLSWVYADQGALAEARALATQLAEFGREHGNPLEEARGRWVLAEVLRRMGDLAAADHEAQVALAMAVPLEQPGVLATLSALRLAQGRAADALATAEDALARGTAMGGCGQFRGAFVRLAHAEALHATGAHAAARAAIARARAYLLAVADKIADPGYRASFLDQVPENARTLALARAWLGEPDAREPGQPP